MVISLVIFNTLYSQSFQKKDMLNDFNPIEIITDISDTVITEIVIRRDLHGKEIFVLNLVKIDEIVKEIYFSISYIYNDYELDEANPVGYIRINDKIVIIRSKLEKEILINYSFHIISKEMYSKIKGKLRDTSFPIFAILYEDLTAIIRYKNGSTSIEYIENDFMVPKEYRKGDYKMEGTIIYSEPIENIIDTVKLKTP